MAALWGAAFSGKEEEEEPVTVSNYWLVFLTALLVKFSHLLSDSKLYKAWVDSDERSLARVWYSNPATSCCHSECVSNAVWVQKWRIHNGRFTVMGRWLSKGRDIQEVSSSGFSVTICLLTLRARLITQTAVGVVNELGTSMGPWYWPNGRSESSHCEFATFALKQRWMRIRCGNSLLLDSSIKRERSSEFISVMSQARRDPVNWILRGTDNRMTRGWRKSDNGFRRKAPQGTLDVWFSWKAKLTVPPLTRQWFEREARSLSQIWRFGGRKHGVKLCQTARYIFLWASFPFQCWFVTADSNGRWV